MKRQPLIRRDLDLAARRETRVDALGLAMVASCHPGAPLFLWYRDGVMTMRCASCHDTIAQVAVASVLLQSELN